jgi:chromosome segregation ATPase
MTSVVELYEALTSAEDDRARAKVIAEAFERLEDRYPHLPELATQGHLRETELRLQKEIEQVRLEIEQVRGEIRETEGRLQLEIEQVRGDIRETEGRLQLEIAQVRLEIRETGGRLQKEIEQVRLQIVQLGGEIAEAKVGIIKWTVGWTGGLLLAQAGLILGGLKLLFPVGG